MTTVYAPTIARSDRGSYHLSEATGAAAATDYGDLDYAEEAEIGRGLAPICAAKGHQRTTAFADRALPIAEAFDAFLEVAEQYRCEKCWDRGLRLKHPKLKKGAIR